MCLMNKPKHPTPFKWAKMCLQRNKQNVCHNVCYKLMDTWCQTKALNSHPIHQSDPGQGEVTVPVKRLCQWPHYLPQNSWSSRRDAGREGKKKEGTAGGLHAPWRIITDWHSTPLLLTECSCVVRMSVAKLLQPLEKDVWGEAPHQVHRQAVTLEVTARTDINFLTDHKDCTTHQAKQ